MDHILNFVYGIDPISLLIGVSLSAISGVLLGLVIKQPKLHVNGGGSGGWSDQTVQNNISITNLAGWFGLKVGQTKIFGWQIHDYFHYGISFGRSTAKECRAHLVLKRTGESLGQLWWRRQDGTLTDLIDIESGKQGSLIVFSKESKDSDRYFVYRPVARDNLNTRIPVENEMFSGSEEFVIWVDYLHGKRFETDVHVNQRYDGKLYFHHEGGSSLF